MIYAWRYPKSIHRSVMIGVNPPGNFLWDPKATDAQIRPLLAAVRKGRVLQQTHGRPGGLDAHGGDEHARPFLGSPVRPERRTDRHRSTG